MAAARASQSVPSAVHAIATNTAIAHSSVPATTRSQAGIAGTRRCTPTMLQPSAECVKSAKPVGGSPGTARPSSASRTATSSFVR